MVSRRGFLGGTGLLAGVSALAGCSAGANEPEAASISLKGQVVEFDGRHQAGIATPHQANLNLVAFTLRPGVDREALVRLMRVWTEDARALCAGTTPLGSLEPEMATSPANLTITCGFGASLFDVSQLSHLRPDWLKPIPEFERDQLRPEWGEADLVLQICCDDPVTLSHATRHMIRSGVDYAATRWMQQGFLNAHGVNEHDETPRNLFGQKDGTVNPRSKEEIQQAAWISDGPQWANDGTCMVVRRIAMNLDEWEILDRNSREVSMGRTLDTGAPLTGGDEFADPDYSARDSYGLPVIDPASHMARSRAPENHPEQVILRRVFNYDLPPDPTSEELSNAGLVFICFQKNPDKQFTPIQRRLDEMDRLNQWITHIGSAVFFVPPGTNPQDPLQDEFWGAGLLQDHATR
ncbi:Dyp-type peroxidase [Corynebacterium crudilactis]|uniref:Peroxidase n=1 Tax=Corynebacterium crudilactis TaxID=1652495 RepID=A0A172QU45_9CORY|nr:Dyp-type peroxidase [Corynebacterium crudilactis]ANE04171.1 peroxidase [Corynebacterium crudilactis]